MNRVTCMLSSVFAVALFGLVLSPSVLSAQDAGHDHAAQVQVAPQGGMKTGEMKMDGRMMEQMAAKKKANTERFTVLMAQVESATGAARVTALADVVAVLLEERTAMQEHCAAMMAMMKK
ncbi:MAG TPA: hypothetical protein VGC23_01015 [Vicinamibacterales bacterium]